MLKQTYYRSCHVSGHEVFFREAGERNRPPVLLLHGFPTSSFMFRNLIPILAESFHVMAPDLPGFGLTRSPHRSNFSYSFAGLTDVVSGFVDAMGLDRFAIYVFDYGAPVGFRLALRMPHRIAAIVSQNGNAYEVGLSAAWAPIRHYWSTREERAREQIRSFYNLEGVRFQYLEGVPDVEIVAPDGYLLDSAMLDRPGSHDIQLDLILDYANNVALYPIFQQYFALYRPPTLAVWGKNDPFFLPEGAHAFKNDNPDAQVELYDTGHFALETHLEPISRRILAFLQGLSSGDGTG